MEAPPEPVIALGADIAVARIGRPITITWTAADVDYLEIDNGIGQVRNSVGSIIVRPAKPGTHIYTLIARNTDADGATVTRTASVTVRVFLPFRSRHPRRLN